MRKQNPFACLLYTWAASSFVFVSIIVLDYLKLDPLQSNSQGVMFFFCWIIFSGTWLDPIVTYIGHIHNRNRISFCVWLLISFAVLPFALGIPIDNGYWHDNYNSTNLPILAFDNISIANTIRTFLQIPFIATRYIYFVIQVSVQDASRVSSQDLLYTAIFGATIGIVMAGCGLVLWALTWRMMWQMLTSLAICESYWLIVKGYLRNLWRFLCNIYIKFQLKTVMSRLLLSLVALNAIGVLLTSRPITIKWEEINTVNLPPEPDFMPIKLVRGPSGSSILAGTSDGGIFRSNDNGQTWQPVNYGLTNMEVSDIITGQISQSIFAATSGGIFSSNDNGQTWQAVSQGITNLSVAALILGPDRKSIFAGTHGDGIFRSENDGQTWQALNVGTSGLDVQTLAIGSDTESIFIGTNGAGILRSSNEGKTWQSVNQGLTNLTVQDITVGPNGHSLFAGTAWGDSVFRSDDNGQTWQVANHGLPDSNIRKLIVDPFNKSLYAIANENGLFSSDNNGETWYSVNEELNQLGVTSLLVGSVHNELLVGTLRSGLLRSQDGGKTWSSAKTNLNRLDIQTLAIGPNHTSLFASTINGGIFRSDDNGKTWHGVNRGLSWRTINQFVVSPDGKRLLARASYGPIFVSTDNGETWSTFVGNESNLPYINSTALLVAPDNKSVFVGAQGGIYKSEDDGKSWKFININPPRSGIQDLGITTLMLGPDQHSVFAASQNIGVLRSDDNGAKWYPVNEGLTSSNITCLAIGPDGRNLFAGSREGKVFRSENNGETWLLVGAILSNVSVNSIVVGKDNQTLVAATTGGMYLSKDNGATWSAANKGLMNLNIHELIINPTTKDLVAATDSAIFISSDNGLTWQAITDGLHNIHLYNLIVTPNKGALFAAVYPFGVVRSADSGRSWQSVNQGLLFHNGDTSFREILIEKDQNTIIGTTGDQIFRFDEIRKVWHPLNWGAVHGYVTNLIHGRENNQIFAGVSGQGMFVSNDNGQTWQAVNQRLFNREISSVERIDLRGGINSILLRPADGELFVGAWQSIYHSYDGGQSWRTANDGLPKLSITAIEAGSDDNTLFAGTYGAGVFFSTDSGRRWQQINVGLASLYVNRLKLGPDKKTLFAGTEDGLFRLDYQHRIWQSSNQGLSTLLSDPEIVDIVPEWDGDSLLIGTWRHGIFRSNDNGQTWHRVDRESALWHVRAITVGPGKHELFVATEGNGVFYSSDNGQTWQQINQGLKNINVLSLLMLKDHKSLLAGTAGDNIYRYNLSSRTWQPISELANAELLTNQDFISGHIASSAEKTNLSRSMKSWLPWAKYEAQAPTTIAIKNDRAILYALAGASTLLRAELPLPVIWRMPTLYINIVGTTWGVINWLWDHLGFSISVSLIVFAGLYLHVGLLRPNQLSAQYILWLLIRPRRLLTISGYKNYKEGWATLGALERLILTLPLPVDTFFTLSELETQLHNLNVAFDRGMLLTSLLGLTTQGWLITEKHTWRFAQPQLTQLHRMEAPDQLVTDLAIQTQQESPIYRETQRLLSHAGFQVNSFVTSGFMCISNLPVWSDLSRLFVWIVIERPLDLDEYQALSRTMGTIYSSDISGSVTIIVIDRAPKASDLYQIFALRAQRGLVIVLVPYSLIKQALINRTEIESLRKQIDLYIGRTDLYNTRFAVTDVLSFFGRRTLLSDLRQHLTRGQSVFIPGVRKIGKSSLIGRLGEEFNWPVATVDLQGYAGGLHYVYAEAVQNWQRAIVTNFPDEFQSLSFANIASQDSVRQAQAFRQSVERLFNYLDRQPGKPGLLLILDEIDSIPREAEYINFAAVLRSLAETPRYRGRFVLLAAGLDLVLNQTDQIGDKRNPFFSFFVELPLGLLDPEETRTMIISIGGLMGISYTDHALDLLVSIGGGHPFLTRQLCSKSIQGIDRPAQIDKARVKQAIGDYLQMPSNYFAESLWRLDSGGPPETEAKILSMLATTQPLVDVYILTGSLSQQERRNCQLALESLYNQGIARRTKDGWKLTIPLYRQWIRHVILSLPEDHTEQL